MLKKEAVLHLLHIIPLSLMYLITFNHVSNASNLMYFLFFIIFTVGITFSLNGILNKRGAFYYLLNILFTLGFYIKFSFHEILKHAYFEPIGSYIPSVEADNNVLMVSIAGSLGLLTAQLISYFLSKKKNTLLPVKLQEFGNFKTMAVVLFLICTIFAVVNLKYNIMLFGLQPSIQLPLKGNVIFFLLLTRGSIFLLFYYLLRKLTLKSILLCSFIASICSIGVISRMIIIIFFATIFLRLLEEYIDNDYKTILKKLVFTVVSFLLFSYLTVKYSTELRVFKYRVTDTIEKTINFKAPASILSKKSLRVYSDLAVERWIGMEGVMAVESYEKKGAQLFWDALREKSYNGKSFYTKIADPQVYDKLSETSTTRSTSVPGPVAFAYYTGSKLFVLFFIAILSLLFNSISDFFRKSFGSSICTTYISVFMVFDYFQFGISPSAFVKYWVFTFFCIILFLHRDKIIDKLFRHKLA